MHLSIHFHTCSVAMATVVLCMFPAASKSTCHFKVGVCVCVFVCEWLKEEEEQGGRATKAVVPVCTRTKSTLNFHPLPGCQGAACSPHRPIRYKE